MSTIFGERKEWIDSVHETPDGVHYQLHVTVQVLRKLRPTLDRQAFRRIMQSEGHVIGTYTFDKASNTISALFYMRS